METLQTQHLSPLDASLVAIFMNGCLNQWDTLPPVARSFYDAGGSVEQLRGCLRHIIVYVSLFNFVYYCSSIYI